MISVVFKQSVYISSSIRLVYGCESVESLHTSFVLTAVQCLKFVFWYLDLGLHITAMTVAEKLMPIPQVCRVDGLHPYFFEENFGKDVRLNSEYIW